MRPVLITTEFRGIFFGYADDTSGDVDGLGYGFGEGSRRRQLTPPTLKTREMTNAPNSTR